MPPKRGRGRGAGQAAASTSEAQLSASQNSEDVKPSTTLNDTKSAESVASDSLDTPPPQIPPNSSPASAPTETPASTPARPPTQRLDSINGSLRGDRGRGAGAASRFKPNVRRRAADERERVALEEERKRAAREKDAAALARVEAFNSRGRGRGRGDGSGTRGRGRGDAMGVSRPGLGRLASGPFSAGPSAGGMFAPGSRTTRNASSGSGLSSSVGTSSSAMGATGGSGSLQPGQSSRNKASALVTKVKEEPDASRSVLGSTPRIKIETIEPIYPEDMGDKEPAPRIDIERINLVTDDEDEQDSDGEMAGTSRKGKARDASVSARELRPVRLAREEHKERITMVNTEPAAAPMSKDKSDGASESLFVPGNATEESMRRNVLDKQRDWAGVWRDEEEPQIKHDPDAADAPPAGEPMQVDGAGAEAGSKPVVDFKIPVPELEAVSNAVETHPKEKAVKIKRRKSSAAGKKPVLQTEEDKAEYARHLEDVQVLAEELGSLQSVLANAAPEAENEGANNDNELQQVKDKEGRLYLFQFPPILPPLRNPVKREEPLDGDVEMHNFSDVPAQEASATTNAAVDLTKVEIPEEEVVIKSEPGASHAPEALIPEEGWIGKLVVRESGKVELSWGGTMLQLGRGAEFDFLTLGVAIDKLDDDSSGNVDERSGEGIGGDRRSIGTGLGRVMGKFVATPDWENIL